MKSILENDMIDNIQVKCDNGQINIQWEWLDESSEKVRIYYKKKNSGSGNGSPFIQNDIVHKPHVKAGEAKKELGSERGIYTFTLIPQKPNGEDGEKVVVDDVLLGKAFSVGWKFTMTKDEMKITFPTLETVIPQGILLVKVGNDYSYRLDYEITQDTVLLFPYGIDSQSISLCSVKPYHQLYKFIKKN